MKLNFAKIALALTLFAQDSQSTNHYISNYFFTYIENNKDIAVKYLRQNADINPDAAYILGIVYLETGKYDLAEDLLLKAASKNHKPSINALGDFYYSDKKNIEKAVKFYEKGAKIGYGPSQFNLGIIYFKHYKQNKKAKYWLTKAAENNTDLCKEIRLAAKKYKENIR